MNNLQNAFQHLRITLYRHSIIAAKNDLFAVLTLGDFDLKCFICDVLILFTLIPEDSIDCLPIQGTEYNITGAQRTMITRGIFSLRFTGVDLDAGSIIGIVVGVLVLVLIIFLLIFARATGRWCFAGESIQNCRYSIKKRPSLDYICCILHIHIIYVSFIIFLSCSLITIWLRGNGQERKHRRAGNLSYLKI